MNRRSTIHALYGNLLALYPLSYSERFLESMQQTFNDLYNERKHEVKQGMFAETSVGIVREHGLLITGENATEITLSTGHTLHLISHRKSLITQMSGDLCQTIVL